MTDSLCVESDLDVPNFQSDRRALGLPKVPAFCQIAGQAQDRSKLP